MNCALYCDNILKEEYNSLNNFSVALYNLLNSIGYNVTLFIKNNIYNFDENSSIFENIKIIIFIGLHNIDVIRFVQKHNIKTVFIQIEPIYYQCITSVLNPKYKTGQLFNDYIYGYDEIWIMPQFKKTKQFLKTYYKTQNIKDIPFLWISNGINKLNIKSKNFESLTIGIVNKNETLLDNCIAALNVVDDMHDYINKVLIYNSDNKYKNPFLIDRLSNTEIISKVSIEKSYRTIDIITHDCNCIIHIQHDNGLSPLFFECFYFGIPIIHNCELLKKYGYYFEDLDLKKASNYIKNIKIGFDRNKYIEENSEIFTEYGIHNQKNIYLFTQILN